MPPDDLTAPVLLHNSGPYTIWVPPADLPAQTNSNNTATAPLTADSLFAAYREGVSRWINTAFALPAPVIAPPDDSLTNTNLLLGCLRFGECIAPLNAALRAAAPALGTFPLFAAPQRDFRMEAIHLQWEYVAWKQTRRPTGKRTLRRHHRALAAWQALIESGALPVMLR